MKENKTILRLKDRVSDELYTLITTGRVLQLTVKKEWYQKIACGEKKEEYREIKPYWAKRLSSIWIWKGKKKGMFPYLKNSFMDDWDINKFKKYDAIIFLNGYGNVPTMIVEHEKTEIKQGDKFWGAVENQLYFTLKLGDVLYSEPCEGSARYLND